MSEIIKINRIQDIIKANIEEQVVDPEEITIEKAQQLVELGFNVYEQRGIEMFIQKAIEQGDEAIEKAKKDLSKLVKKVVVGKDGNKHTVYIDPNKDKKADKSPKKEEEEPKNKSPKEEDKAEPKSAENKKDSGNKANKGEEGKKRGEKMLKVHQQMAQVYSTAFSDNPDLHDAIGRATQTQLDLIEEVHAQDLDHEDEEDRFHYEHRLNEILNYKGSNSKTDPKSSINPVTSFQDKMNQKNFDLDSFDVDTFEKEHNDKNLDVDGDDDPMPGSGEFTYQMAGMTGDDYEEVRDALSEDLGVLSMDIKEVFENNFNDQLPVWYLSEAFMVSGADAKMVEILEDKGKLVHHEANENSSSSYRAFNYDNKRFVVLDIDGYEMILLQPNANPENKEKKQQTTSQGSANKQPSSVNKEVAKIVNKMSGTEEGLALKVIDELLNTFGGKDNLIKELKVRSGGSQSRVENKIDIKTSNIMNHFFNNDSAILDEGYIDVRDAVYGMVKQATQGEQWLKDNLQDTSQGSKSGATLGADNKYTEKFKELEKQNKWIDFSGTTTEQMADIFDEVVSRSATIDEAFGKFQVPEAEGVEDDQELSQIYQDYAEDIIDSIGFDTGDIETMRNAQVLVMMLDNYTKNPFKKK